VLVAVVVVRLACLGSVGCGAGREGLVRLVFLVVLVCRRFLCAHYVRAWEVSVVLRRPPGLAWCRCCLVSRVTLPGVIFVSLCVCVCVCAALIATYTNAAVASGCAVAALRVMQAPRFLVLSCLGVLPCAQGWLEVAFLSTYC
jgi:hypothetical protein